MMDPVVTSFNSDADYTTWLAGHEDWYILNTNGGDNREHSVLHKAACLKLTEISGNAALISLTDTYSKFSAETPDELARWRLAKRPNGDTKACNYCMNDRFIPGVSYKKEQIYKILSVPKERQRGNWDTGYTTFRGNTFLFCNIGTAGRDGVDHGNYYDGQDLVWHGKSHSAESQPSTKALLAPEGDVYVFTRLDARRPYMFNGTAVAISHSSERPVQIRWRFQREEEGPESDYFLPDELNKIAHNEEATHAEGGRKTVVVNFFERSSSARDACVAIYGTRCAVPSCNFDFGEAYGSWGSGFIHVHHLKPLHEIGGPCSIIPSRDLRPVCPNCHAMLHRKRVTISIEELDRIIRRARNFL